MEPNFVLISRIFQSSCARKRVPQRHVRGKGQIHFAPYLTYDTHCTQHIFGFFNRLVT